jgi:hypothetical protein
MELTESSAALSLQVPSALMQVPSALMNRDDSRPTPRQRKWTAPSSFQPKPATAEDAIY